MLPSMGLVPLRVSQSFLGTFVILGSMHLGGGMALLSCFYHSVHIWRYGTVIYVQGRYEAFTVIKQFIDVIWFVRAMWSEMGSLFLESSFSFFCTPSWAPAI